jgi:hypothetical protein
MVNEVKAYVYLNTVYVSSFDFLEYKGISADTADTFDTSWSDVNLEYFEAVRTVYPNGTEVDQEFDDAYWIPTTAYWQSWASRSEDGLFQDSGFSYSHMMLNNPGSSPVRINDRV